MFTISSIKICAPKKLFWFHDLINNKQRVRVRGSVVLMTNVINTIAIQNLLLVISVVFLIKNERHFTLLEGLQVLVSNSKIQSFLSV